MGPAGLGKNADFKLCFDTCRGLENGSVSKSTGTVISKQRSCVSLFNTDLHFDHFHPLECLSHYVVCFSHPGLSPMALRARLTNHLTKV